MQTPQMLLVLLALAIGAGAQQPSAKDSASARAAIGALGWVLFAVQLANAALSFFYFGPPAVALSGVLVIILGFAAWLVRVKQAGEKVARRGERLGGEGNALYVVGLYPRNGN